MALRDRLLEPESASELIVMTPNFSLVRRSRRIRPEASSFGGKTHTGKGANAVTTGGDAQGDAG